MENKSLLERTNSWKPFIDEIQGAVKARDYRKQTVKTILHIVDPDLSMWPGSLWRYLCGFFVGIGFPSGRVFLYEFPLEQFIARKGKVFENAPLAALQEFNSFVSALLPKTTATRFLLDEKLARRRLSKVEETLHKEEKTRKSIIEWSLATAKELSAPKKQVAVEPLPPVSPTPPPKPEEPLAPEQPPPLFSDTSTLDKAIQEKIEEYIAASSLSVDEALSHKDHERKVISLLEKAVRAAQLKRQNSIVTLSSPRFFIFHDLIDAAAAIPPIPLDDSFLMQCFQEPDIGKVTTLINNRLAECEECYTPLIKKADTRTKIITEIRKETQRLKGLIEPFIQKKDLAEQTHILLSQLAIIQIPETIFDETNSDVIEKRIGKERERLEITSARIESQFREFILQNRELTRTSEFLKMMLYAARWELISTKTPYPDLASTTVRVRDELLEKINTDCQKLLLGKSGLSDFSEGIVSAIYDVDVKLLRGELTARSLRLKDLRSAIVPQLLFLDQTLSLLSLSGNLNEKAVIDREWVCRFLYKLLSPYQLFQDTYDPESINILFRYWWMDLERFLRGKDSRYYAFLHATEEGATRLIRPIGRTLDTIEKIQGGKRQTLYQRFVDTTKEKHGAEAAAAVDHWLHDEGTGLIGALLPQLSLIPHVDLEPLIEHLLQIEQQMRDVTLFAKAIQTVKTYEPERIDSLLEVFSIFPFVESFDQPVVIRLQNQISKIESTIQRIEEELVVELGLLDKKARMESGYAITNLLPQTLLKVPPIISSLSNHLHLLAQRADPYVSSIAHFLQEDTAQLSQSLEAIGFDQEQLFTAFQKLSILLFHRKMLDNAIHTKNFARILLLITATGQIVKRFRIMEAKESLPLVGTLIDELDALSSSQWNIVAPDLLDKVQLSAKLQKFILISKRIIATSGLTERREAHLITGIEKVCQELSEEISYEIPRLSFVPGDLEYLWRTYESTT